jgi:drug/metabolite transporter (DMT)-like permease
VTSARVFVLTLIAMVAFAGNSLLCRVALKQTSIDAASFTFIRIASGALALWLIVRMRGTSPRKAGSWFSAATLFAYAAGFSFAYITLPVGTGALLLFGAVQATMIFWAFRGGEQMDLRQRLGLALALAGLVTLLFPGLSAPPLAGSILMIVAGIAWAVYSLRGKNAGHPAAATAGNFLRAVPMAAVLSLAFLPWARVDRAGVGYAVMSGAIASGVGYAIWYTALSGLRGVSAASVQLVVPVLAALGGILFLGEQITLRFLFASVAVLGGIGLVVVSRRQRT